MSHYLYYIHDPMCSWCYGFRASLATLRRELPESIEFRSLLGGLAPDNDTPMPEAQQHMIQQSWQRIEHTCPEIKFNFGFWTQNTPRRSTYPACRAVLVAQQHDLEAEMIAQIQQTYYQAAQNPSDEIVLCHCAEHLGLDSQAFRDALHQPDIEQALQMSIEQAIELDASMFPSLRLDLNGSIWPIEVDYCHPQAMLDKIQLLLEFEA